MHHEALSYGSLETEEVITKARLTDFTDLKVIKFENFVAYVDACRGQTAFEDKIRRCGSSNVRKTRLLGNCKPNGRIRTRPLTGRIDFTADCESRAMLDCLRQS